VSATSAVLVLALLALSGGTSSALAGQDFSEFAFRPHPGAHLPLASEFVDDQGGVVPLGRFFAGKPVVLVLDYLRCKTLCGLTLENLGAGLGALPLDAGRDFQVVVISIDPRDKPADVAAAKAKYLDAYHHPGGDGGWHFLTGPQVAVEQVANTVGFPYRYEPALEQYIHPAGFVVAAPDGTISRYLLGVNPQHTELQDALADAAQGRAVGPLTRLLLLCHGDTPQLGRYSLLIDGAFLSANLIAMIGGIAVFVAIRRRRHG
jgi:protein SCO1/2